MKHLMITSLVLLTGISGQAMADCNNDTKVTGRKLENLISGNTVCATRGAEKWQEQHRAGSALWDYKKGPTDKVDPSKQVGTWDIASNEVIYSYTGGGSYVYSVHGPVGGLYSFCSGGAEIVSGAMFLPGSVSCP